MTTDPLTVLAAANPVPELPPVAPSDSLACLRENPRPPLTKHGRRPRRLAVAAAAVIVLVTVAAGLTLSDRPSGPGVDVAAAAYAATSPGSGIIEAEFVIRRSLAAGSQAPIHHREWLDATAGRRREQTLSRDGSVESEVLTSPGWAEIWESGPTGAGTILRVKDETRVSEPVKPDGLGLYRRLYQGGSVRVVGRETLDGQTLWKLEGSLAFAQRSAHGSLRPIFGEVVLVDPATFLPVVERQINLTRPGHPTLLETRLLQYRRLPEGASSKGLVPLSASHPGALILGNHPLVKRSKTSKLPSRTLHSGRTLLEQGDRAVGTNQ